MKFKDRVFGANVEQPIIDIFNNLQKGSFDTEPLDEAKPTHQDYLGDRTTFARMWTAFLATGSLEDGSLFQKTFYHVVNSNEDKSYEANEPLQDRRFTELTENPYLKPTAGITSVSTKTEGALGAIKRTTVEFMVHSKRDFDTIFLPNFLKPGATVVVDYGWSEQRVNLYSVDDVVNKDDVFLEKLKTTIYGGTSNGEVPDEEFAGRADQNLKLFEIDPSLKGTSKDTRRAAWDGMRKKPSVVGFLNEEENKGIVDTVVGRVITYNASVTEQGSFQCSLELVSENASLLDAEVTEDNSLKFLFDNKVEDLLVNMLSRTDENAVKGTAAISTFNALSAESRARITEEFFDTLNLSSQMNPNDELESNTVIPAKSLKAGIFYQSITNSGDDTTNREVLYIAYGLFEDLFLNAIVAENQDKSKVAVNFNTEDTFVRYDANLIKRQQQILYEDEELPLFLLPDSWTDTYNGKTDASVVNSQKNPESVNENEPGTPIIPWREVFISAALISDSFKSKQNVNDALDNIMEKINEDSYGVYKLKMISLNSAFSSISFEDANLIPQPPDDPVEILTFDVTSGNSIVYNMDYKYEMPKGGLQNMIAIGQKDTMEFLDNASKDNLNFLNILGPDRNTFGAEKIFFKPLPLTKPVKNEADEKSEKESKPDKDFAFKVPKNILPDIKYQGDITTQFSTLIKTELSKEKKSSVNEGSKTNLVKIERNTDFEGTPTIDCESDRDFYGKLASLRTVLSSDKNSVPPILPVSISLTIYGNTYLNVGDAFLVNFLPDFYKENIFFQITNINHKLGSNWETTYDTVMRLRPDKKGTVVKTDPPDLVPRISRTRIINQTDVGGKERSNAGVKNTIIDGEKISVQRKGYIVTKVRHRYDKQAFLVSRQEGTDNYCIYTSFPQPKSLHDIAMMLAFRELAGERIGAGASVELGTLRGGAINQSEKFKMNMYFAKDIDFVNIDKSSAVPGSSVIANDGIMAMAILMEDNEDDVLGFDFNATQDAIHEYFADIIKLRTESIADDLIKTQVITGFKKAVLTFLSNKIGNKGGQSSGSKKLTKIIEEVWNGSNTQHHKEVKKISQQDALENNLKPISEFRGFNLQEPNFLLGPVVSDYGFVVPQDGFGYTSETEDIFSYSIQINKNNLAPITIHVPEWFIGRAVHPDAFVEKLDDLYGGGKYSGKKLAAGNIGFLSQVRDVLNPFLLGIFEEK